MRAETEIMQAHRMGYDNEWERFATFKLNCFASSENLITSFNRGREMADRLKCKHEFQTDPKCDLVDVCIKCGELRA